MLEKIYLYLYFVIENKFFSRIWYIYIYHIWMIHSIDKIDRIIVIAINDKW